MFKFKVCMLGAFAVGKTSLVQRFVHSLFDERYQTTLGVKIDRKSLVIDNEVVDLILWDLAGEDEFMEIRESYLRGSAAGVLVADGTRAETLDIAVALRSKLEETVADVPVVLMVNKADLADNWTIEPKRLEALRSEGWVLFETSARTDDNVEQAFTELARQMMREEKS